MMIFIGIRGSLFRLVATVSASVAASHTAATELDLAVEGLINDDACAEGYGACSLELLQRKGKTMIFPSAPDEEWKEHWANSQPKPPDLLLLRRNVQDEYIGPPSPFLSDKLRARTMEGTSVYFLVIDRFARVDGNTSRCISRTQWCGGTLKGITAQLDYIHGMGFDTLWITPVQKQYEGETQDGTAFMGYWAKEHYEIDPHYGTHEDMLELVEGLHARGMKLMLDFVANHVGPVHSLKDVQALKPFNDSSYLHTLDIGDKTFDEYLKPQKDNRYGAAQAMWSKSGGQCSLGDNCNCFACVPIAKEDYKLPPPSWDACPFGKMVHNSSSPCPDASLSAFCMPGDYGCRGYNETVTLEGWFYDLGDLNQSHPFVRKELKHWVRWLVDTYKVDMLRLDTAGFVPWDFLSELQEAAGVPIIGEVTATNLSYHASFQRKQGKAVLDGVLNFPLYYTASAAFCHTWFPMATGNLTFLAVRAEEQSARGLYQNLDTLGNFADNHDVPRMYDECKGDAARILNLMVWTTLMRGVPIVYYGSEQAWAMEQRESFWQYNNSMTRGYFYMKALNRLRKDWQLETAPMNVKRFYNHQRLAFSRGADERVWVYLNNMESGDAVVQYCDHLPQKPLPGFHWIDYFTGLGLELNAVGCLAVRTNMPLVLVQVRDGSNYSAWYEAFTHPTEAPSTIPHAVYHH